MEQQELDARIAEVCVEPIQAWFLAYIGLFLIKTCFAIF